MTWRTVTLTLALGVLLGGCTAGSGPAPVAPAPSVSASPAPSVAPSVPPAPKPSATTAPTAPTLLRDGMSTPDGTSLVGEVTASTTGTIASWSATVKVTTAGSAQQVVDDLAAQLTTAGMTTVQEPGHLSAQKVTAAPAPVEVVRVDVTTRDSTAQDPAYVYITVTHDPELTS